MAKQHTEDYKRSAVKYALKIGNQNVKIIIHTKGQ